MTKCPSRLKPTTHHTDPAGYGRFLRGNAAAAAALDSGRRVPPPHLAASWQQFFFGCQKKPLSRIPPPLSLQADGTPHSEDGPTAAAKLPRPKKGRQAGVAGKDLFCTTEVPKITICMGGCEPKHDPPPVRRLFCTNRPPEPADIKQQNEGWGCLIWTAHFFGASTPPI